MFLYKTVFSYGEAELTIEKSKFIARVTPVSSYEEAQSFVNEIKLKYKDATHNVPAIVCGPKQEYQWASDDGEPSGTSGLPMLKVATEQGLTNLAIVVTRYFGGVKLGTGGLSRAYTQLAKLGIEAAGICSVNESLELSCEIEYSALPKLQHAASDGSFEIYNTLYSDKVIVELGCLLENEEKLKAVIANITLGQAVVLSEKVGVIKTHE